MRRNGLPILAIFLFACCSTAYAQDCPSAATVSRGFVVERGDKQRTEVFVGDDGLVRTRMRYGGQSLLETTLFAGLLPLDRFDRGRRTTSTPLTDLKTLFPLRVGQKVLARFTYSDGSLTIPTTIQLFVKGTEQIAIGPCNYTVLKIEHSEGRGEGGMLRLVSTDYYAPDLKLVLMKEYKEIDGRSTFVKFDKIYPVAP
ncbi:MAG: hypothetical protein JO134_10310 [Xanthobacteraceae bacterium]|nr:hypothetical protein [Xanthobacteraceae bacterium]